MKPVPHVIATPRTCVRSWGPADAAAFYEAMSAHSADLAEWLPWAQTPPADVAAAQVQLQGLIDSFESGSDYALAIFGRDTRELLGGSGFHPRNKGLEIGYWLAPPVRGQGYMTEVVTALTEVALDHLKVPFVEIVCDERNKRSAAVPQRLGFDLHERRPFITEGLEAAAGRRWDLVFRKYAV